MSTITATVQQRRDTAANWTSNNPTLLAGEIGWETDTKKAKLGDGATAWNSLAYITALGNATSAPASATLVSVQPSATYQWTNQPAALDWFLGQARWTRCLALAGRTQMKVHVFTASTGSYVAGSKIRLLYRTQAAGYSATITDYAQLGSVADVEVAFAVGTGYYSSGWIDLAAGAQTDVIIAVAGIDGNATADPVFLGIGIDYR